MTTYVYSRAPNSSNSHDHTAQQNPMIKQDLKRVEAGLTHALDVLSKEQGPGESYA
jgi:hypothetical protein